MLPGQAWRVCQLPDTSVKKNGRVAAKGEAEVGFGDCGRKIVGGACAHDCAGRRQQRRSACARARRALRVGGPADRAAVCALGAELWPWRASGCVLRRHLGRIEISVPEKTEPCRRGASARSVVRHRTAKCPRGELRNAVEPIPALCPTGPRLEGSKKKPAETDLEGAARSRARRRDRGARSIASR